MQIPSPSSANPVPLSILLRRGLGRAVFSVRSDYVPERDRATILWHATHYDVLDRQFEPRRGLLLSDVIPATGEAPFYSHELARVLRDPAEDTDLDTVFDTAWRLAKAGVLGLREAMYEAFARNVAAGDMTGVEAIVHLDREVGVRFAARLQRDSPLTGAEDDDNYERHRLLYAVEDTFGKDAAPVVLDRLTAGHDPVAVFLRQLRAGAQKKEMERKARPKAPQPPAAYDAFCAAMDERIADSKRPMLFNMWARRLDSEAIAHLADDLRAETDDKRLTLLVRLFGECPLPGDFSRLEVLTESVDIWMAWYAVRALAHIRAEAVRRRGLDFVYAGRFREGVELLVKNPGSEDAEMLNALMARELEDEEDYHLLSMEVRDYAEANPDAALAPALCAIYELGQCSLCRYGTVNLLLERDWLPDAIRAECRYDADEDIRALVAGTAA